MIRYISPSQIALEGYDNKRKELEDFLTYTDKSVIHQIQRFKKNKWFVAKYGEEVWTEHLRELEDKKKVCLLKDNITYSGLANLIAEHFHDKIENDISYRRWDTVYYKLPDPIRGMVSCCRYINEPPKLYDYQSDAVNKLFNVKHGAISLPTGSGKSLILLELVHMMGLASLIITPTKSIAHQLYIDFTRAFGKNWVGLYGDGKKEMKFITIAIDDSLVRIERGSYDWKFFSALDVLGWDESHLSAPSTLRELATGLCGHIPYRFFTSATQMRNDGSDLLLKGIIGPIVYQLSPQEAIDRKYLAKPNFKIIRVHSNSGKFSDDPIKMIQFHWYHNTVLYEYTADIANKSIEMLNHQVLILLDHVQQFKYLYPLLRHEVGFAHSGVTKDNRKYIPEKYWKSKPNELVERFNNGNLKLLIGTASISLGTNIIPVNHLINLQSGKSEIKFTQNVGRATRMVKGVKEEFFYTDFDVFNVPVLHNMAKARAKIYNQIYPNVDWID